jgi:hypothetical protein
MEDTMKKSKFSEEQIVAALQMRGLLQNWAIARAQLRLRIRLHANWDQAPRAIAIQIQPGTRK